MLFLSSNSEFNVGVSFSLAVDFFESFNDKPSILSFESNRTAAKNEARRLACPFYQRKTRCMHEAPWSWDSEDCLRTPFEDSSDLERHLQFKHDIFICTSCFVRFQEQQELAEHRRRTCTLRLRNVSNQKAVLRGWRTMYSAIYPGEVIPSARLLLSSDDFEESLNTRKIVKSLNDARSQLSRYDHTLDKLTGYVTSPETWLPVKVRPTTSLMPGAIDQEECLGDCTDSMIISDGEETSIDDDDQLSSSSLSCQICHLPDQEQEISESLERVASSVDRIRQLLNEHFKQRRRIMNACFNDNESSHNYPEGGDDHDNSGGSSQSTTQGNTSGYNQQASNGSNQQSNGSSAKHSSSSQGSGNGSTSRGTGGDQGSGGSDGSSGGDQSGRHPRASISLNASSGYRCTYNIRYPNTYSTKNPRSKWHKCETKRLRLFSDLLKHLWLPHKSHICGDCLKVFQTNEQRMDHQRKNSHCFYCFATFSKVEDGAGAYHHSEDFRMHKVIRSCLQPYDVDGRDMYRYRKCWEAIHGTVAQPPENPYFDKAVPSYSISPVPFNQPLAIDAQLAQEIFSIKAELQRLGTLLAMISRTVTLSADLNHTEPFQPSLQMLEELSTVKDLVTAQMDTIASQYQIPEPPEPPKLRTRLDDVEVLGQGTRDTPEQNTRPIDMPVYHDPLSNDATVSYIPPQPEAAENHEFGTSNFLQDANMAWDLSFADQIPSQPTTGTPGSIADPLLRQFSPLNNDIHREVRPSFHRNDIAAMPFLTLVPPNYGYLPSGYTPAIHSQAHAEALWRQQRRAAERPGPGQHDPMIVAVESMLEQSVRSMLDRHALLPSLSGHEASPLLSDPNITADT